MYYIFRQHQILRWSEKEILQGYKLLPKNIKITLKQALAMKTPVKIDEIVFINGRFIEATNFLALSYEEEGEEYAVNIKIPEYNNPIIGLPREIEKLYFSNMYYSPFKMVKRMYSLGRHNVDENLLLKILPFVSSNVSLLYQIKSEIDTIILILEKIKTPPMKSINKQLDEMKGRIVSVIELTEEEVLSVNEYVNTVNKTKSKMDKIKILKLLNKMIKKIINEETIYYLNKVGLNPPPRYLLPNQLTYAHIIRTELEDPKNPIDKIIEEMESKQASGYSINLI
jgi:hypothetical protein